MITKYGSRVWSIDGIALETRDVSHTVLWVEFKNWRATMFARDLRRTKEAELEMTKLGLKPEEVWKND